MMVHSASSISTPEQGAPRPTTAVGDDVLRSIAEQGFFGNAHSLADARSACAELIFARSVIEAQTARIRLLAGG